MGKQADFLDDIADAAAQLNGIPFQGRFALDSHLPFRGIDQTVDQFHRRGFARAASPEQHERLAAMHFQREIGKQGSAIRQAKTDVMEFDALVGIHGFSV
jgi:hypothetical protein